MSPKGVTPGMGMGPTGVGGNNGKRQQERLNLSARTGIKKYFTVKTRLKNQPGETAKTKTKKHKTKPWRKHDKIKEQSVNPSGNVTNSAYSMVYGTEQATKPNKQQRRSSTSVLSFWTKQNDDVDLDTKWKSLIICQLFD